MKIDLTEAEVALLKNIFSKIADSRSSASESTKFRIPEKNSYSHDNHYSSYSYQTCGGGHDCGYSGGGC